jgi:hypothetical protein
MSLVWRTRSVKQRKSKVRKQRTSKYKTILTFWKIYRGKDL